MKRHLHRIRRAISPIVDPIKLLRSPQRYAAYLRDWYRYANLDGAEKLSLADAFPCLHDNTRSTPYDAHYLYQDVWAFRNILASGATAHVDVGSRADFVAFLSSVTRVTAVDIRPLEISLPQLAAKSGSVLAMPFADSSVMSLSSLHVLEHIGLGRYGDPLDPHGTSKAARELTRVLAPHGNLFVSMPIGIARVCFNAHRVHSASQVLRLFSGLDLIEFSAIDDLGKFTKNAFPKDFETADYSCGLFWFRRNA